jgi:hypothetical protein
MSRYIYIAYLANTGLSKILCAPDDYNTERYK